MITSKKKTFGMLYFSTVGKGIFRNIWINKLARRGQYLKCMPKAMYLKYWMP